ncbi:MAG: BspA family leucine-rich repeat surface protein, partial [Eggerthellaceae bacterium]|nr:BspA family leucine-rich repeat surface protein [Eggerthellaceae bacterium]
MVIYERDRWGGLMMQGIPSRVLSMMVSILLAIGLFPLSALALDAHEGWEACGTCEWQVSGGHLAIRPIDGVSGTLADKMSRYRGVPWSSQAASITSASIAPGVKAGSSCCLFANMANLVDISGLSNLDVSGATSLSGMFSGCASLKEADLSSWDTSKVTTMDSMFYGMRDLRSLNLAGFNTSSVSQMGYMFAEYSAPAPLDLSSFDLSSISNMDYMFENYSSSTALNLKSLNFGPIAAKSQVWMRHFLEGYSSSAALDLSPLRFPTGSGDYTDSLFARYASSRPLDLSRLNLSGVKGVLNLFDGYSSTAPLDLSALRMPDATSANGLVCNSNILDSQLIGEETLDLSKMTNIKGLFNNLRNITSIDVSHWNTSRVVDMSGLLEGCASLKTIDLSSLDCSNVKYFGQPAGKDGSGGNSPFYNCTALESAVMPRIALSSSACLFEGCSSLKDVDLSRVDFSNARYAYKAFYGCASLRAVPSGFSFGASTSNDNCFYVDSTAPIAIEYSGSDPAILSYNWAADNRELLIVSPRISVDAPQPVSGLTYTGGTLVGVPESALYTRSGEYSATNAGSYICTVSLNDASSYRWSDGSTASKTISWSIAPAEMT